MITKNNDTWVIMPGYNEEKRIGYALQDVKKYCNNIIVIDDGSTDNTLKKAEQYTIHTIRHSVNLGKGAALKTGSEYALKHHAKYLIYIDSDGQHQAKHIPEMIQKLKKYDIVFGSRKFNENMPFILKIGNIVLSKIVQILFGVTISDSQSGYRGLTTEAYKKIRWKATDYSVESEMLANCGKQKLKYTEITISTIYTDRYKGTTPIDGIKIMFNLIGYKIKG